jgi:ankyrin repeat protein
MEIGAKWLLEHGANPNVVRKDERETPLHAVCRYATKPDLIELLLDHGADPTIRDRDGNTPYQTAFACQNRVALDCLESRGIREEPTTEMALLSACARNDEAAIRRLATPGLVEKLRVQASSQMRQFAVQGQAQGILGLLAAGFSVTGEDSFTPLHWAAMEGQPEAARILIEHGAPLDVRDEEHHAPPIGWACYGSIHHRHPGNDHVAVVRLLLAAGSSRDDARKQLEFDEHPEEIREAIRANL